MILLFGPPFQKGRIMEDHCRFCSEKGLPFQSILIGFKGAAPVKQGHLRHLSMKIGINDPVLPYIGRHGIIAV